MSTYKEIVGKKIKKVTSDPSNSIDGQMWYNSTTGTIRGVATTTAWITGGTYLQNVFGVACGGPVDAAVGAGGYSPPGPSSVSIAAEYNGSGWTSIPSLNTARGALGSSKQGTQTAFWVAGGSSQTGKTEEWNGSSWSEDGDLNTGRRLSGTAGSLTAGLAFGGYASPAGTANSEEYNGTSWSEGNNLGASLYYNTGFGSQTAAISACGNTGSPDTGVNNSYEYDGTSWTSLPSVSYSQQQGGSHGSTSEGFVYGGSGSPSTYLNTTSEWSGTAWSTIPQTLPAPARAWNGTGSGTAGLQLGGSSPSLPNGTTNTNEFTRSTNIVTAAAWASGGALTAGARRGLASGKNSQTLTAGLVFGGGGSPYSGLGVKTEEYDGTSFTAAGDLNTYRYTLGGAGTQTAGLGFGGYIYPPTVSTNATEEYNGSSWTSVNNMSDARQNMASFGTQTAAIAAAGYSRPTTSNLNTTLSYDGTNWTALSSPANVNTTRSGLGGSGTQTAGLATGDNNSPYKTTEEWDGSAWTTQNSTSTDHKNVINQQLGTQTNALICGGGPSPTGATEAYDGTSWSTRPSMATGRYASAAGGSGTSGFVAGGFTTTNVSSTEEFTGETIAANVKDFTTS